MSRKRAIDWLCAQWLAAGVTPGTMLLLHSAAGRTIRRVCKAFKLAPDPELVLDSFLAALGERGTLLLPLFNFEFNAGTPFDMRSTPSRMGTLTECARLRSDAVRTGHPVYSFAALGARRAEFAGVDNFSGYGADSPFGVLHRDAGKIAVLDLPDNQSMTFYHYVEQAQSVDYRYHKTFTGQYTGEDGVTSQRTYGLFVRDLSRGVQTHVDPMGELLWSIGAYAGDRPGVQSGLRVIDATRVFDEVSGVIASNRAKGLLYATE